MASKKLVGYDSGEDSDSVENISHRRGHHEQEQTTERSKNLKDTLAAEWESFEKLIQADNDEQPKPAADEQTEASAWGTDCLKKLDTGGHALDRPFGGKAEVRQKRVFREVQSESDGNSNSDSEDESRPVLPAVDMNSGSGYKRDQRSSSSDSSQSAKKLQAKSDSSESDSSSDDDKPTDQAELPVARGKSSGQKSSSDTDASSDSDSADRQQTGKSQVSDRQLAGHKPASAHGDARGTKAGDKRQKDENAGKEKSPSRQAEAQERIRAKLIAISEQPAPEVKRSQPAQSSHARSPSPKYRSHNRRSSQHSHPATRRSRSRSRSGRRHRHSRDDRSRSHSASRSCRHHRDHRRRHSRDRHSRRHSRHRSRDRRRSPSRSPPKPKNFKEQLKEQLFTSQPSQLTAAAATATITVPSPSPGLTASTATASAIALEAKKLLTANEKRSNLPLNASSGLEALLPGNKNLTTAQQVLAQTMAQKVTPQQALMQTMAAMHQKAQQLTGVAVPSYYNPAAVNPLKYAEQLKKRKMLWSKGNKETTDKEKEADSKTVQSVAQWTGTSFAADEDGKVAAKFRKLMGIREEDKALLDDNVDLSKLTEEQRRRQEELFAQLDKEYAFARMTTHTCRGVGLGFQSQGLPDT